MLAFVILPGATNSFHCLVAGWPLIAVAGPHFSFAGTLRFVVGGVCSADCGFVAGATGGGVGD
jgi:hypothetical protein